MIAIELPWPPRVLHPNSREHWAAKARATKKAREDAGWLAREAGIRTGDPDIPSELKVTVTFSPPNSRAHDRDNLLANCKAYFDGIADVLGVNDSGWDFETRIGEVVPLGSVLIELEAK